MTSKIAALILAAGESKRLGRPKQLVTFGSTNLVNHTINTVNKAGVNEIWVVLGAFADEIKPVLNPNVEVLINPHWKEGMSAGLRAGVKEISVKSDVNGVMIVLCDQPKISPAHFASLASTFQAHEKLVCSYYNEHKGVPAIFPRSMFGNLEEVEGDKGARLLLRSHPAITIDCPECSTDVDTPEDLERLS